MKSRLTFLLVLAACAQADAPVLQAQSNAELVEQVRATEIAFAKSMADRDFEAFKSFLSPEAIFFNGDTLPVIGMEAVIETWAPLLEGETPPFSWHPDLVVVLESGTLAHSTGPVRALNGEIGGRFNSIWRRKADGSWRIVFDKGS